MNKNERRAFYDALDGLATISEEAEGRAREELIEELSNIINSAGKDYGWGEYDFQVLVTIPVSDGEVFVFKDVKLSLNDFEDSKDGGAPTLILEDICGDMTNVEGAIFKINAEMVDSRSLYRLTKEIRDLQDWDCE